MEYGGLLIMLVLILVLVIVLGFVGFIWDMVLLADRADHMECTKRIKNHGEKNV